MAGDRMNVKQLKELIKDLPDDTKVVLPEFGYDGFFEQEYNPAYAYKRNVANVTDKAGHTRLFELQYVKPTAPAETVLVINYHEEEYFYDTE